MTASIARPRRTHYDRHRRGRQVELPPVLPIVLRRYLAGCPVCGSSELEDRGTYCAPCEVFCCPQCSRWRNLEDGGGDDPECNDCWAANRTYRRCAMRRTVARLRIKALAVRKHFVRL